MKKLINITILVGILTFFLVVGAQAAATIAASQVTYNGTTVQSKLDEFTSTANTGKSLIASAITNKGVSTSSTATFQTMANNINAIPLQNPLEVAVGFVHNMYNTSKWIFPVGGSPSHMVTDGTSLSGTYMTVSYNTSTQRFTITFKVAGYYWDSVSNTRQYRSANSSVTGPIYGSDGQMMTMAIRYSS